MQHSDNYAIAAGAARRRFLTYDLSGILAKSPVTDDAQFVYLPVLDRVCRVGKSTGKMAWSTPDGWEETERFNDVLTIFDYLCDGKENRRCTGEMKAMASFGHQFHTGLLENSAPTPLEKYIDTHPERFQNACLRLGGTPFPTGDLAYTLPFFPDLTVTVQFWHSDEDFPPQLRYLWDAAATDFIRYETMYYAVELLLGRLRYWMESAGESR